MRERRAHFEAHPELVQEALDEGCSKAGWDAAEATMVDVAQRRCGWSISMEPTSATAGEQSTGSS